MDDFGNFVCDVEHLFSGYDYGPFGVSRWQDQAEDLTDLEFFFI